MSLVAPLVPHPTSSIVNGRSRPGDRTAPESGTAGCDHESATLRHGPHCASVRALKQPSKRPAGTLADSWGRPCQLMIIVETTPRYVDCSSATAGGGISCTV